MKCPACPLPGGEPCLAETDARFSGFCAWAHAGNPVHLAHIIARSRKTTSPGLPIEKRPSIRTHHATTRTLLSCPYRDHHFGCNLPTCHAGYGSHDDGRKASRDHCLACLKTTWSLP